MSKKKKKKNKNNYNFKNINIEEYEEDKLFKEINNIIVKEISKIDINKLNSYLLIQAEKCHKEIFNMLLDNSINIIENKTKEIKNYTSKLFQKIYKICESEDFNYIKNESNIILNRLNKYSEKIKKEFSCRKIDKTLKEKCAYLMYKSEVYLLYQYSSNFNLVLKTKKDIEDRNSKIYAKVEVALIEYMYEPLNDVYNLAYKINACAKICLKEDKQEKKDLIKENILNEIRENQQIEKIFSFRELNSLAEANGFKLDRCHGDHGIFQNDKGDIVVIPQGRNIGKGLSILIQKNIYSANNNALLETAID